jgi:flavin-dependent dehydrogenase
VESAAAGWWFSALNSSGGLSIAFYTNLSGVPFEDALRATVHTSKWVSHLPPERPVSRPARTDWLDTPVGPGWLAIGDAAFSSDPLGSQGLLRALETAEKAAALVLSRSENSDGVERDYRDFLVDYRDRFLRDRKSYYAAEQRWPDAPFWRTAHTAMGSIAHTETIWAK